MGGRAKRQGDAPEMVGVTGLRGFRSNRDAVAGADLLRLAQILARDGVARIGDAVVLVPFNEFGRHQFRDAGGLRLASVEAHALGDRFARGEVDAFDLVAAERRFLFVLQILREAEAEAGAVERHALNGRMADERLEEAPLLRKARAVDPCDEDGPAERAFERDEREDGEVVRTGDVATSEDGKVARLAVVEDGERLFWNWSLVEAFARRSVEIEDRGVVVDGCVDEVVRQERAGLGGEGALVVLVVARLVERLGARFIRCDRLAGLRVVDLDAHPPGVGAAHPGDLELAFGRHAVEHVARAVARGGDAAEEVRVGGEDGFGRVPDGGGVLVEGELVKDQVTGEAAGGAGIGRQHFNAPDLPLDFHGDLKSHVLVGDRGREILEAVLLDDLLLRLVEQAADLGGLERKLLSVVLRVGEDGDEASGTRDQTVDGPCREGE